MSQGDIPDDPKRRDFLRKIGLGAPVAIGGILAAGGLSVSGGFNQALTDARYVKKKPFNGENLIQSQTDSVPGLEIRPFSLTSTEAVLALTQLDSIGQPTVLGFFFDGNISRLRAVISTAADFFSIQSTLEDNVPFSAFRYDLTPSRIIIGMRSFATSGVSRLLMLNADDPSGGVGGIDFTSTLLTGAGAQIGLPTSTLGTTRTLSRGDHRHAFSGRFFFSAFLSDLALGGALPVIWQRALISPNSISLRRLTVNAVTPSTGVGNDVIRCGDGTTFITVNLPSGGVTASAIGTVNIASGSTLRIDVNGQDTVPAKNVNAVAEYVMNV